ncbi:MAG: signal transduction histidine kinase [Candidatus Krumholzibacteriia bacterium]|jgi:signal transduction histidine kinase
MSDGHDWHWGEMQHAVVIVDQLGVVLAATAGANELLANNERSLLGAVLADSFVDTEGCQRLLLSDDAGSKFDAEFRLVSGETVNLAGSGFIANQKDSCAVLLTPVSGRRQEDQWRESRMAKLSLLNQVSDALYGADLDLEQILQAILVCMTADQGLRFNRAFVLLVDGDQLLGKMAIGPGNADEAARIWHELADQPAELLELVARYDQTLKETDVTVNEIVEGLKFDLAHDAHVLIRTLAAGHVQRISREHEDESATELCERLTCQEFAVAPMITRRGPVGIIVADNAISGTPISDLDLEFLQMFANQSAGAIENSRLYAELAQRHSDLGAAHEKQREDQETLLKMERLSVMGETSAIVAHELRNPLVAIGGFARSLSRNIGADDPNLESAKIIVAEVGRMERIIHDLLDFIRPPKMLRQRMVVDEWVAHVTETWRARVEESEVNLVLDLQATGTQVEMHPGEIQQVVQNFLLNALQALDGPGEIEVCSRRVDGGVKVIVKDDGPGFEPDLVEKLRAPFFSTKPTGSGLGLTICAQIIKAHGGVLAAENRKDHGAEFSFILPLPKNTAN